MTAREDSGLTAPEVVSSVDGFDSTQAELYFDELYRDLSGFIDVRSITATGSVERTFHSTVEGALQQVENAASRNRNVYVGIAERRSEVDGTKRNLGFCSALWIDVDYKGEGDREATSKLVESFPMPPSLRVWSGGGEHIYWFLEEPFDLSTVDAQACFENTLRGLCDHFNADRAATDSTRILRVLGTTNYPNEKKRAAGRTEAPCVIISTTDRRYSFGDFDDFETRGASLKASVKPIEFNSIKWSGEIPESVEIAAKSNDRVKQLLHTKFSDLQLPSPSEADFALAISLARLGIDGADIENTLRWRHENVDVRSKSDGYFHLTATKAIGEIAAQDSPDEPVWGERKPIQQADPVRNLSADLLPGPLAPWIQDGAERMSVPKEFITAPVIVAIAGLVGRKLGILPKEHDDWLVVPNLWGGIIGPPGVLKSPAIQEGFRPIGRLENRAAEVFEVEQREAEKREIEIEAEIKRLTKQINKLGSGNIAEQIADLKRELRECKAIERRYLTQDATVEKLGELLKENPRGMTLLRDELAGFFRTLNRPGREREREFYLEAWNGDGGFTVDRIGRGTIHIPALTLSIFGGIQPGKFRRYVDDALDHKHGDDGLLQRLQIVVWPDRIGEWSNVDRWPDSDARDEAFRVFELLDSFNPSEWPTGTAQPGKIPALHFSGEAQELFNEWRADLEGRLRGKAAEATPSFTAHLAKYRSLMPSLALLFHLIDSVAENTRAPVSIGAARLAAAWCEYLELHARKVYFAELSGGAPAAQRIADRISKGDVFDGMTVRNLNRAQWSGLSKPEVIREGLDLLEELDWVRIVSMETNGRSSTVIRLHPELREKSDG